MSDDPIQKVGAWVPVSAELAEDLGWNRNPMTIRMETYVGQAIYDGFERTFYPWRFPDRRVLPEFELFPRWARMAVVPKRVVVSVREGKRRVSLAWAVLRGRESGDDY